MNELIQKYRCQENIHVITDFKNVYDGLKLTFTAFKNFDSIFFIQAPKMPMEGASAERTIPITLGDGHVKKSANK